MFSPAVSGPRRDKSIGKAPAMGEEKILKIGDKLIPEGSTVGEEVRASLDLPGPRLMVALKEPTRDEVTAYQFGALKVALFSYSGVLFFLLKAGNQPWLDTPFSMALERFRPDHEKFRERYDLRGRAGEREILNIFLVESPSGTILARRATPLPEKANAEFRRVISAQLAASSGADQHTVARQYNQSIDRAYGAYPTAAMAKGASHVFQVPVLAVN